MNKPIAEDLDIPVSFGGVSIGQTTARLSMTIDRIAMRITKADKTFCNRRLTGQIRLGGDGDSPDQTTMFEKEVVIDGTFDIHRFGVKEESYSTGATFKLKEIEIESLAKFSKGSGRLIVVGVAEIPTDVVEEDDPAAGHLPGQFKAEGPWTNYPMDSLFSGVVLKALKSEGIDTVGDLQEFQSPKKNGHVSQLGDIKGVGPSKVKHIEDVMLQFWADNPQE